MTFSHRFFPGNIHCTLTAEGYRVLNEAVGMRSLSGPEGG